MNIKATKTPLLIAAIATAVTLTAFVPANAKAYWVNGSDNSVQVITADLQTDDAAVEVIDANFKFKKHRSSRHHRSHRSFRGHKFYGRHKTRRGSKFSRSNRFHGKHHDDHKDVRKKIIIKKLF